MDMRRGRSIDQQAERFGVIGVTARAHQSLARVDLSEVEIKQ
jgi:hypothetical protein